MTEENKASNDLVNSKIEIVPGVFIDDRMRIGGMMFLEERTGKEFFEIVNLLCTKRTTIDIYNIFLALVIQANENMDIKEAEKITKTIEFKEINTILERLRIFSFAPKNVSEPIPQAVTESQTPV